MKNSRGWFAFFVHAIHHNIEEKFIMVTAHFRKIYAADVSQETAIHIEHIGFNSQLVFELFNAIILNIWGYTFPDERIYFSFYRIDCLFIIQRTLSSIKHFNRLKNKRTFRKQPCLPRH